MIAVESATSSGFTRPRSFTRHSRSNSKNASFIKPIITSPVRRLTIDSSQIVNKNVSLPQQSSLETSSRRSIISDIQNHLTLKKSIQNEMQDLKENIKTIISIKKQCIGLINRVNNQCNFDKYLTENEKVKVLQINLDSLQNDCLIQQKDQLTNSINDFEEMLTALKISLLRIQNSYESFNPVVLCFTAEIIDKFMKFNVDIKQKVINIRNWCKSSLIHKRICKKNSVESLEQLITFCASIINVCVPLFESDRLNIQRKIEVHELLIQFKGTTSCQNALNDSISLSDLVWAKSNLISATLFTTQLTESINGLDTFLIANDLINLFTAACQYNPSVEIFNPLFEQISEDKIIHAGIAFLKLQTNDDICRYQKCYLFLTTIGLLVLFVYSGNIVLPCDFINAKKLTNADIEIILPQDNAFAADLHISFKETKYKKEFYFAFQHDCEVIEWGSILKESLPILDVVTLSNFDIGRPIATKITKRRIVSKKPKYVGSSIEELVQFQQTSSCIDVVPDVFNKCINEIINKGLMEDGLFRKPPDQYQLEELMKKLNDVEFRNILKLKEYPVGTICGLLKSLLMEMNPRFINGESYKLFVGISRKKDPDEMRKQIGLFIDSLNIEHRNTLERYLFLMNVIATNKRLNRMGESNLSTAICQCFLPQKDNVDYASIENDSFECLITNYDLFLPKKFDNPTQFPSLVSIIKKQTKTENTVIHLCLVPQKNIVWLIEPDGCLTEVNANTFQCSINKIELPFTTIKQIESNGEYIIISSDSSLVTIEVETKQVIQMVKRKEINCFILVKDTVIVGEQNGVIEIFEISTLQKKNEFFITPKRLDTSQKIPSIHKIVSSEEMLYVLFENNCEIGFVTVNNGNLVQTISMFNQSKITVMKYFEENQTLWIGSDKGNIKVFNSDSGIIIEEFQYPLTYGSIIFITSISKYVIVVFNSSQVLLFNSETISLICSISNKYFITSKWANLIKRNYNGRVLWNIWMEKDDSGDVGLFDITRCIETTLTDEKILKADNYLHNTHIEKSPLGHSFMAVPNETKNECYICQKQINGSGFKCLNCNHFVHQQCISQFVGTECKGTFKITHEIINKSK